MSTENVDFSETSSRSVVRTVREERPAFTGADSSIGTVQAALPALLKADISCLFRAADRAYIRRFIQNSVAADRADVDGL